MKIRLKYIWDSIVRHPVVGVSWFILSLFLSLASLWVGLEELKVRLGDRLFWIVTIFLILVVALTVLILFIWSKVATYLFYNDYTKSMAEYLTNASKHDVWHLSKATKEFKRVVIPEEDADEEYRYKVLDSYYKNFTTLTKHTFGDVFSDLEKILSQSLYTKLKISLQLFPKDFEISKLGSFKDLSDLQYSESFVEDGRMNLRDSVKKPLTEEMKHLMFSKNLTHIYKLKPDNEGIIFILTAKSFSEFPKIYGFLDFNWGKLSRPFMNEAFIIEYIIPIILERVNVVCYYISGMEVYLNSLPAMIFHDPEQIQDIVGSFDFLAILHEKYNE
ncbi:TPA: hypothetical protein ACLBAX_000053 [Streptococcus suis]